MDDVAQLFERYGPMVLRRCRSMLGDDAEAHDAAQEVFARVIDKDLDVRHPSSLLYQMATHECLTRLRTRRRRPHGEPELVERIATAPEPEARLASLQILHRIFAGHPPSTRVIATLFLVDGLTWEQVAAEVGMSVSGVRRRLRTLRAHLSELEDT